MTGQIATPINYDVLEATSETLFNTLHEHGVFGSDEGKFLESQRRGFHGMINRHVTSGDRYLEITYSPTGVRLIVMTEVDKQNTAQVKEIDAYDHPWKNENLDYDALNRELHAALS